eukprot:TRINITY_DN6192_c0_g1_i7.p1 TRINITY_DN6192_c0_g1~~TRINITY_DN6192_c0_g1_i7.p1  ORF type:complete len:367 (-),score=82.80 TRINITY_DN6192_c0_g1_i7:745-1845(-)
MNHCGTVRFGKLLEKIDLVGGIVAYKHILKQDLSSLLLGPLPALGRSLEGVPTVVTASCERILVHEPLAIDQDIVISGNVVAVGKSSMDVHVTLRTREKKNLLSAEMTMVAKHKGRSFVVPDLCIQDPEDVLNFQRAREKRAIREKLARESLHISPPNAEEALEIHRLIYTNTFQSQSQSQPQPQPQPQPQSQLQTLPLPLPQLQTQPSTCQKKTWINMDRTNKQSIVIMQPMNRNIHHKIFGGFLMKVAFENAWSTAYLFEGQIPHVRAVSDLNFFHPVEIGSVCTFNSLITYTNTNVIEVEVQTLVENPVSLTSQLSNKFHFTFFCEKELRHEVMPQLYEEAMKYIESKRRLEEVSVALFNKYE